MTELGLAVRKGDVERAVSHFGIAPSEVTPQMVEALPPPGTGLQKGTARGSLSDEDVNRIAEAVVEKAMQDVGTDALMLHSLPYLHGSPGIVVNEPRAKTTPCKCVEYKPGKNLCWSPGIIGALTDEQEELYCPIIEKVERPGTVSRIAKWQEAVDACKGEIALIPEEKGKERMVAWLSCMSRELTSRGVNPELQVELGVNPRLHVAEEVLRAILRRQRPQESISQTIARLIRSLPELRVEENLLTHAEHEVLRLAAEGLSNRAIAEQMGIEMGTVRAHLMDIRRKVGVTTREEAMAAFGEPTERERVPIRILRLPRPPSVIAVPYERRAAGLLPLVKELERNPSMETLGELEDGLLDLAGEVGRAYELVHGREAVMLGSVQGRLKAAIRDTALVRTSLTLMERETLPMRIEAAKRSFLTAIRVLRESLETPSVPTEVAT